MESERINLKPNFKTLSDRNLMEYTFCQQEPGAIQEYQLEMLANNRIPGLLQSDVIRVDDEIRLSFDITSRISLKKLFERREIGRDEFLKLLKQIVALLDGLDEYLLEGGGVVFDSQYIFVNPQDLSMEMAYLPLKEIPQTLESLKNLLLNSIIHDIRFRNEAADNFIQRLIELLKAQSLNNSALKAYVQAMEDKSLSAPHSFPNEVMHQNIKASASEEALKETKAKIPFGIVRGGTLIPLRGLKLVKWHYPSRSYYILGSVLGAFLILGLALSFTETLSVQNPDFLLSLFGYLMIGGAVTYLVYTKLFTPDKRIESNEEKKGTPVSTPKPKKNGLYMPSQRVTPRMEVHSKPQPLQSLQPQQPSLPPQSPQSLHLPQPHKSPAYVNKVFSSPGYGLDKDNTEVGATLDPRPLKQDQLSPSSYSSSPLNQKPYEPSLKLSQISLREHTEDRTVLLDGAALNLPCLKGLHENVSETIVLSHFPFMLGRLDGQVDYCFKNPAVGKLHAEITKTSEGYFISDMNTRNGTLVEGERLEPTRVYKVENGSRITFANEEFLFYEGRRENQIEA